MSQPAEKMPPLAFDTHKTVKNIKAAGFTERMAEALVNAIHSAISSAMKSMNDKMDGISDKMENFVTHDDLEKLELRLTIKLGGLITVGVIILAALDKLAGGGGQVP